MSRPCQCSRLASQERLRADGFGAGCRQPSRGPPAGLACWHRRPGGAGFGSAELVHQSSEGGECGADDSALGHRQLIQRSAKAALVGLSPSQKLLATGVSQPHDGDTTVLGCGVASRGTSLDELLHQPADGSWCQVQLGTDVADPDPVGVVIAEALQEFYLGHRQRFPRVVAADPRAQHPPKAVDDVGEPLGITG